MEAILLRLLPLLPPVLRRHLTPVRLAGGLQFLRFAVVGTSGFIVDTACVYALRRALGLYGAGLVGWLVAVTANWAMNRAWTFRGQGAGPAHHQLLRYAAVNMVGFALNRGAYAAMVTFVAAAEQEPILATAAGAVAGLFANFFLSRAMVFR